MHTFVNISIQQLHKLGDWLLKDLSPKTSGVLNELLKILGFENR